MSICLWFVGNWNNLFSSLFFSFFNRFDTNKSTKGASKLRRDLINTEIANLRDLLPLPQSTRQRLSQLQLMALVCVYVRKANYFQQGTLYLHDPIGKCVYVRARKMNRDQFDSGFLLTIIFRHRFRCSVSVRSACAYQRSIFCSIKLKIMSTNMLLLVFAAAAFFRFRSFKMNVIRNATL